MAGDAGLLTDVRRLNDAERAMSRLACGLFGIGLPARLVDRAVVRDECSREAAAPRVCFQKGIPSADGP